MTQHDPIPDYVLDALEIVRASGKTNMLMSEMVIWLMVDEGHDEAAAWLETNEHRYLEVLRAMGKRRKQ